jgi:type 2 lantibiotic biosynthesis protein LanM
VDARIAQIAADAATLTERLGADWLPQADEGGLAERRLARWQDRASPGDAAGFAERLRWLDREVTTVLPRLAGGALTVLPDWCGLFDGAMARNAPPLPQAGAHPFGPLLAGFVAEACERLPPVCREAFGEDVRATLVDDLLTKLSYLAAPVLQIEFAAFRSAAPGEGHTCFDAFAAHMAGGGLWAFYAEYAALARLLSLTAKQWIDHVATLAADFVADRAAIAERFGDPVPAQIVALEPSLSDAHNHGRSVAIVTLDTGRRLAYKPRAVGIEAAWFALLAALDGKAGSFKALTVLDRGTRGWVEIAAHGPCADATEARAFYARAGNLLALLYALEASDCFHENIVAAGGFPVLIDMETLMHPVIRPAGDSASPAEDILFDSVLRAGLLPVWEAGQNGVVVDISGLGAQVRQVTPYLRRRWSAINRDAMTLHHEPIEVESLHHLPMLDGTPLRVADYATEVLAGFRRTYAALIEKRDDLLAPSGLIAVMAEQILRLVFHPTRLYGLMLKRLSMPKALRSGIDRSIEFDVLARFYLNFRGKAPYRALLGAELAALERGDIPYFTLRADATDLPVPGGTPITQAFASSAIDRVRARLARFDAADLALQTDFVRASLAMAEATAHAAPVAVASVSAPPATPNDMRRAAIDIGETLRSRAIRAGDSVTWIAPQLLPQATRYELRPLRLDFYGGQAGVALFLAALARITGTGRNLALTALAPLRRGALPSLDELLARGHTIGAATGVGGIVYVLARCADLLSAPDLLNDALAAARLIGPPAIDADVEHDVMAGVAGTALGLLAVYDATGDTAALASARHCGDHLLRGAQPMTAGIGWASGRYPPTTGLSHGAAGIVLALSRLAERTGDTRYRDAADQALAIEAWAFDRAAGNWRDLRDGAAVTPAFMNAWCHGGLGIGLARLAMSDSPGAAADIAAAVALNEHVGLNAKDGLCCGTMARTELLCGAGNSAAAHAVAGQVLRRAATRGQFALSGTSGADFFDPSFFQGLSGIGYQLLRLAVPSRLPNALVWA